MHLFKAKFIMRKSTSLLSLLMSIRLRKSIKKSNYNRMISYLKRIMPRMLTKRRQILTKS